MRVVFMGTPDFAVPILRSLLAEHEVVAVYTQPDRPAGRGRRQRPSPVKDAALEARVPVEQPITLRAPGAAGTLASYGPDVVCVAAYGLLLPADVLAVPRHGCLNVHASLLPRHRGAAPVERAILDGDALTGVSIMRMEEGLDTGPWAVQVYAEVDGSTADTLRAELARLGASALIEVLRRVAEGRAVWTQQTRDGATYAAKVTADDLLLEPSLTGEGAMRRVRASGRTAPSRTTIGGRPVTIEALSPSEAVLPAGEVRVIGGRLLLGFADAALAVERLVPAGRRSITGAEYARGARLRPGEGWGAHP